jgi:hypothetical protein
MRRLFHFTAGRKRNAVAGTAPRRSGDENGRHGWFSQTEPPHIGQRSAAIGREAP